MSADDAQRRPARFPPPFASAWGDDEFGLWAEFELSGEGEKKVRQRMRWIEPGTFWMGSPDDEVERLPNEGPPHLEMLSEGFWLADTACTQELWTAVMGSNPSRCKDSEQLPVENVSWNDVQELLRALEVKLLVGCQAELPTEAQWEYACRAGTETPFSFGMNVTPTEVNYEGDFPYAGGAKGEDRGKTVAVKSMPANPWGLYEMHGNVWEWCADGLRQYSKELGGDHRLTPYVLSPTAVPQITDPATAKEDPELAVFSAMAHGQRAALDTSVQIALAAIAASAGLDSERARLYVDLVLSSINEAARRALQAMNPANYEYQSEFARRYFSQGKAEGKAEGEVEGQARGKAELLIKQATLKFGPVPEEVQGRIRGAAAAELDRMGECLVNATTLDEMLSSD